VHPHPHRPMQEYWTLLPVAAYAGASSPDSRSAAALHDGWAGSPAPLAWRGVQHGTGGRPAESGSIGGQRWPSIPPATMPSGTICSISVRGNSACSQYPLITRRTSASTNPGLPGQLEFGELLAKVIGHPHQAPRLHGGSGAQPGAATSTAAMAAVHTSAAVTRPPRSAACPATRLQLRPGRLPAICHPAKRAPPQDLALAAAQAASRNAGLPRRRMDPARRLRSHEPLAHRPALADDGAPVTLALTRARSRHGDADGTPGHWRDRPPGIPGIPGRLIHTGMDGGCGARLAAACMP
jgi:hypothetical protein